MKWFKSIEKIVGVLFFLIISFSGQTQNITSKEQNQLDSLENEFHLAKEDTLRITILLDLCGLYSSVGEYSRSIKYGNQALEIAKIINNNAKITEAYSIIARVYEAKSDYERSLKYYHEALIYIDLNDSLKLARIYRSIGIIHVYQSNYSEALDYLIKNLKIIEKIGDPNEVANAYGNLGGFYFMINNEKMAIEYYQKSLDLFIENNNKYGMAGIYNNIGLVKQDQNDFYGALDYGQKSLVLEIEIGNDRGIADSYNNIGDLYAVRAIDLQDSLSNKVVDDLLDSAETYQMKALEIQKKMENVYGLISSYRGIGKILYFKKKWVDAIEYYEKAIEMAGDIGAANLQYESYKNLADIWKEIADCKARRSTENDCAFTNNVNLSAIDCYKNAYKLHQFYVAQKDSVFNSESSGQIAEMQTKYEADKKAQEIELLTKENEIKDLAANKNQIILYGLGGGTFLTIILFVVIYNRYRLKKKSNDLQEKKNEIIEKQKQHVEQKNKELMDSIVYAKRIQDALLKDEMHESLHLPSHFILFKPKDVVSGDFYWALEKENYLYLAVADCTGHGVPGAFLTMLGTSFLNEINAYEKLLSPAEILEQLRERFISELSQKEGVSSSKDGMDISLIRLNLETKELEWAGANNPLYLIVEDNETVFAKCDANTKMSSNGKVVATILPDKQPIGFDYNMQPFKNHSFKLEQNDYICMFSDGYADQFGGAKGKKFKYKPFKELLLKVHKSPMEKQKSIINETFENWKGDYEQIDDVCLIGMRI